MGWLSGWDQRRIKFTTNEAVIDTADLTWFRVVVKLSSTHGDCVFDELTSDANRFKIAFTKDDGTTELYGEIEKWDDANESAIIHVSRDGWVISNTENTDFYMYYDKDHADNTTYIGEMPAKYALYLPEVVGNTGNPSGASKVITAVNCTGLTKSNGYLQVDLKCSNPAIMSTNGQLEITSSQAPDTNEWALNDLTGLGITTSYQTFYIPLSNWATTGGELNVAAINFIRWFNFSTDGNITVSWKNACIIISTDTAETIKAKITAMNNVWDSNSKMVQHSVDVTTSKINDSTLNLNDGAKKGAGEPASATGKVGLGQDFAGDHDYIAVGNTPSLDFADAFTLEIIAKPDNTDAQKSLISRFDTTSLDGYFLYQYPTGSGAWHFEVYVNGVTKSIESNSAPSGEFQHIVAVRAANGVMNLYVDGEVQTATQTLSGAIDSNAPLYLGCNWNKTIEFFAGIGDEVILHNTARTAGWIKADYNSLFDTLLTYGNQEIQKTLSGDLYFAGTNSNKPNKVLSGAIYFTGNVARLITAIKSFAGSLNFSGTLSKVKTMSKILQGSLNFVGSVTKLPNKILTGALNFSGTFTKLIIKVLSGMINLSGNIYKLISKTLLGTLNLSGTLTNLVMKILTGVLNFSGSFTKSVGQIIYKTLTGSLYLSGAVTKKLFINLSGAINFSGQIIRKLIKSLSGVINFSGAFSKTYIVIKNFAGSLYFAGTLSKKLFIPLSGIINFSGTITKILTKTLLGALNFSGTLEKKLILLFTGSLNFSGIVIKNILKTLLGSLNFLGLLTRQKIIIKALRGSLYFSGDVVKKAIKVLSGTLNLSGLISKRIAISLSGILNFTGDFTKFVYKILAGTLYFIGNIVRLPHKVLTGSIVFSGTVGKLVYKVLGGILNLAGSLSAWLKIIFTKGIVSIEANKSVISIATDYSVVSIATNYSILSVAENKSVVSIDCTDSLVSIEGGA